MFKQKEKMPTQKVGIRKKRVVILWAVFIMGFTFAVYKHFTAVDTHTVHETTVVKQEVIDTNSIESFVTGFAKVYYSWDNTQDSIKKRNEDLKAYLTEPLQELNRETVPSDTPVKSGVQLVQVWAITQKDDRYYDVLFTVRQSVTEGESTKSVNTAYTVTVYQDESGCLVIVKNPMVSPFPQKSEYKPDTIINDETVSRDSAKEIEEFLITFFKVYPKADDKEVSYYVKNKALLPVNQEDFIFAELINPVYRTIGGQITVDVTVKYLDQKTKMTQLSQYTLVLEKADNWYIVGA